MEKAPNPLSQAEVYGEEVLEAMREKPGDCDRFDTLIPHISNNPLIAFKGPGGGSIDLALNFLKRLFEIHEPKCKQKSLHKKAK